MLDMGAGTGMAEGASAGGVGAVAGGALDLLKGLFGTGNTQNTNSSTSYSFRPGDEAAIRNAQGNYSSLLGGLSSLAGSYQPRATSLANGINSNFSPYQVSLGTNFAMPNFSGGLDPTAQAMVSQGIGNTAAGVNSANSQLATQLKNSPGLLSILQNQNRFQGNLSNNSLPFQAFQEMQQRLLNQANATNTGLALQNQAKIQQSNTNAGLQQAGNSADIQGIQGLLQALGISQIGANAGAAGSSSAMDLGKLFATANNNQHTSGQSGGLLSAIF